MPYKIRQHTKKQAKKIGVQVKPSKTKGKKIDVFKNGKKIASVGDINYKDYSIYLELEKQGKVQKGTAEKRRRLYKKRHKARKIKNSNSYFADQLLW